MERLPGSGYVRTLVGHWLRQADAGLVRGAARNAAHSVFSEQAQRLEYARAVRDLQNIGVDVSPAVGQPRRLRSSVH
jgi:hypothetical protein